jgi:alkylation response protein AidB-like acyl-CoA dehydrogenase
LTRPERRLAVLPATESRSLDFSESADQVELRQRARQMAAEGVARYGAFNDSWIIGFSQEFTAQLAALSWIGLTWPVEYGAGGRPAVERLIISEELISADAPIAASWFADRQMGRA